MLTGQTAQPERRFACSRFRENDGAESGNDGAESENDGAESGNDGAEVGNGGAIIIPFSLIHRALGSVDIRDLPV